MSSSGPSSSSAFRSPGYSQSRQTSYMTQASSSSDSAMGGDAFTRQMRDRQARGKDPYHSGDGSEGSDLSDRETSTMTASRLRLGTSRYEKEDFSRAERRDKAAAFLDNPELLMMFAQSTGDSIPGARLHFTKMLCGYDDENADGTANSGGNRKSGAHRTQPPPRDADKRRGGDRAASTR